MTLIFLASGKVVKKILVWINTENGEGEREQYMYIIYGEGGLFSFFLGGGAEVNFTPTQTKCSHTTHPPPPNSQMINNKWSQTNKPKQKTLERLKNYG